MGTEKAVYELGMEFTFCGFPPRVQNMAAPELTPIEFLAVETVRDMLIKAGFEKVSVGHGCRRIDLS